MSTTRYKVAPAILTHRGRESLVIEGFSDSFEPVLPGTLWQDYVHEMFWQGPTRATYHHGTLVVPNTASVLCMHPGRPGRFRKRDEKETVVLVKPLCFEGRRGRKVVRTGQCPECSLIHWLDDNSLPERTQFVAVLHIPHKRIVLSSRPLV